MAPFTRFTAVAVRMAQENIDTDLIFPARFLLLLNRDGLGQHLFNDHRFLKDGAENPDFILNKPPFRQAGILLAGENFGCGSSREQAVWSLADFGFRVVIAPSFGEIFFANCLKNGVLPIVMPASVIATLAADGQSLTVDLQAITIEDPAGKTIPFTIAPDKREALLNGWDDTDLILQDEPAITSFEGAHRASQPWLFLSP